MIVAVIAVRMMKAAVDDVVNMITMGHRFMSTARAMDMPVFVLGVGHSGAAIGILFGDWQRVLDD